jgi:hypothetical protein
MLQTVNIHLPYQIPISHQKRAGKKASTPAGASRGLLIAGVFDRIRHVAQLHELLAPNSRSLDMLVPDFPQAQRRPK